MFWWKKYEPILEAKAQPAKQVLIDLLAKELVETYDLSEMVIDRLRSPLGFGIYAISIAALGFHMWHAFQSAFQTLGVSHPRYRNLIKHIGRLITVLLVAGFGGIPLYLLITG